MQKYTNWVTSLLTISIGITIVGYSPLVMARPDRIALVANKSTCQNTVKSVRSQLSLVKSVRMKKIAPAFGKYPRGRSMVAELTIVNNHPRSEQLINSSAKLLTASQKIAKNCADVGMIQFYIDQTDNGTVFGSIDGQIKQFTCNNEPPIKWGEVMCP